MNLRVVKNPGGDELVLMPKSELDALRDALDAAKIESARVALADRTAVTLSSADVLRLIEEPTPLAYWRKARGLTQADLARAAGISTAYAGQIERGERRGEPVLFLRFARRLGVRMEDLVVDEVAPPTASPSA